MEGIFLQKSGPIFAMLCRIFSNIVSSLLLVLQYWSVPINVHPSSFESIEWERDEADVVGFFSGSLSTSCP